MDYNFVIKSITHSGQEYFYIGRGGGMLPIWSKDQPKAVRFENAVDARKIAKNFSPAKGCCEVQVFNLLEKLQPT